MTIRRATIADLPSIVELAVESVSVDPIPVVVDRDGMRETGRSIIGHPSHFVWVDEVQGEITAAVAAVVQKGFWFRGTQCSVLLFYARRPAGGARLLKKLADWIKGRPSIKVAVFELEPRADPRIAVFLHRLGFTRHSSNMSFIRGAT